MFYTDRMCPVGIPFTGHHYPHFTDEDDATETRRLTQIYRTHEGQSQPPPRLLPASGCCALPAPAPSDGQLRSPGTGWGRGLSWAQRWGGRVPRPEDGIRWLYQGTAIVLQPFSWSTMTFIHKHLSSVFVLHDTQPHLLSYW